MTELDKRSEDFAIEYENKFCDQYSKIDKYYPEFRKNVSQLLKMHSDEAKKSLANIYTNQDNINTYKNVPEFAYMYEIMQIYIYEYNTQYKFSILDTIDTIDDFVHLIEQTKFLVWRIEFIGDKESKECLIDLIKNNNLSPYYIAEIVRTASFTDECYIILLEIFSDHNMLTFVFNTLNILNQLNPGDETTLCLLADLTASIGRLDKANEYLDMITSPGKNTERIRMKYGL